MNTPLKSKSSFCEDNSDMRVSANSFKKSQGYQVLITNINQTIEISDIKAYLIRNQQNYEESFTSLPGKDRQMLIRVLHYTHSYQLIERMKKEIKTYEPQTYLNICIPDTENPKVIYKLLHDFFGKQLATTDDSFNSQSKYNLFQELTNRKDDMDTIVDIEKIRIEEIQETIPIISEVNNLSNIVNMIQKEFDQFKSKQNNQFDLNLFNSSFIYFQNEKIQIYELKKIKSRQSSNKKILIESFNQSIQDKLILQIKQQQLNHQLSKRGINFSITELEFLVQMQERYELNKQLNSNQGFYFNKRFKTILKNNINFALGVLQKACIRRELSVERGSVYDVEHGSLIPFDESVDSTKFYLIELKDKELFELLETKFDGINGLKFIEEWLKDDKFKVYQINQTQ